MELTEYFLVLIMGCDRKRRWLSVWPDLLNELSLTEMAKTTIEGGLEFQYQERLRM